MFIYIVFFMAILVNLKTYLVNLNTLKFICDIT